MTPKALFTLCDELLHEVLRFTSPTDAVVSAFFRRNRMLGMRERHALAETVYAVLRERLRLQYLAKSGTGALERRLSILAWQGTEAYLRAATTEAEQKWAATAKLLSLKSQSESLRHNLPDWLAEALKKEMGNDFWPLIESLSKSAGLDLRVNTLLVKREAAQATLAEEGILTEPTPYSPTGLRARGKPTLNLTECFKRGEVEVQDEGSQLLALLTEAKRGEMVVDFCAGAGGKTLALGAMMRNTGRLYAFDVSAHRLAALKPRLARSGLSNVYPAGISHERDERIKRLSGKIDRVLVDAPCSGLGTLRRNPDLKWRQTPEGVAELTVKQRAILDSAARLVKAGGQLVYATCSLLDAENESIAQAFSEAHPEFELLNAAEVLARQKVEDAESLCRNNYLRLWPHRHGTDGFFAAVWRRRAA
ncbi:RsmB/NOP family class I SAM-dependent RNA methyltransferase [Sphaerotilus montanus]|uniref:16S rRNA (Cytosine967-C5)-methyltransferase n=1 Tax=Sphaerotilus montanus TaxID=522889 RepID=A0A7Y9QY11_9BURK|nr:RsmB/NOP family class I SAM-dependent RNA methyltransferase [Sphaerotilus montanus]NYG33546.1 16S rRNA (cytosine967-C5)-methyltransferase [Sphaerotilus montanus]NZD57419.1 RsmB/NOP family class I SAM-dependent RNA methyltransferase [Sphaerotilus montanus]